MTQNFTLKGKDELISQLRGIGADVEDGVSSTLKAIGEETRDKLREELRPGEGTASDPFDYPYSQTGNLKKNIFAKLDPKLLGHEILLTIGISSKAFYGFILEYGAANYPKGFKRKEHKLGYGAKMSAKFGQRLLPRPWFWSIIERFWEKSPIAVENAVNKVLIKYAK